VEQLSGTDWQAQIYLRGFAGLKPSVPLLPDELERLARQKLSHEAFAYIAGGAGLESTVLSNRVAFENLKIVPRVLRDVSVRDTGVELFGKRLPFPLLLAPVGVLELAHPHSDLAVAEASVKTGVPFIFSNQASTSMEVVSEKMGDATHWFQLYWSKSRELVSSFVRRAEQCGCTAIVVTLDTTLLGWRTRDLDVAYLPFLEGKGIAQYTSDPVFLKLMEEPATPQARTVTAQSIAGLVAMVNAFPGKGFIRKLRSGRPLKAVQKFVSIYSNPALTWNDLVYLRGITRLPVLLKGVLHEDDARRAVDHGVSGIIVSNHGGRQVDGAISTIEALPYIRSAVGDKIPVLLDGGVRGGADIFKAIALGATAVCIGRPYAYGLAISGAAGVYEVVRNLAADFELTMALAGCSSVSEITGEALKS
jgi:lactate 2-monooxygenase